jgi:molybdopterin-synthase adenylyltransferase
MTPDQRERYSRQIRFKGLGEAGQEKLMQSTVAVVGCGALGSFHAGAMARAGVGKLILIDRDYLEPSNLQRQWLYDEADVLQALPKAPAAASHVREINSGCEVDAHVADLTPGNIDDILHGCDVVLDGCDNFETRYLINDYAVSRRVPWVYGGAVESYGVVMPVLRMKLHVLRASILNLHVERNQRVRRRACSMRLRLLLHRCSVRRR